MKLLRSLGGVLALLLLGSLIVSVPAGAQTLTALALERTVTLNNILTTVTPMADPASLAAIASGAIEIREQINLNAAANTVTSTFFFVPAGSPNPTNLALLPFNAFAGVITTSIANVYFNSKPTTAVTIVGNVVQSTPTAYGSAQGGVSTLSFGYSSDKPPKISNVIETNAGYIVIYSASAQGTFTITQPPSSGGGGGSAGITVVVNGATVGASGVTFQTLNSLIVLDASASTTSNSGATLKYLWTVAPGSPSATIVDSDKSKVNIQLGSGKLTYVIQLKVTDSSGASSTVNITIQFV